VKAEDVRWIAATSLALHRRHDCPALKALETRCGWRAFAVPRDYGPDLYRDCKRCGA